MCLLTYKPYGKKISEEEIRKAWCRNSDGAGIMYKRKDKPDQWYLKKGIMTLQELIEWDILGEDCETVAHLRWASPKTGKTPELCHPFRFVPIDEVKGDFNYLFHNGNVRMMVTHNQTSDTEMFAEKILSELTHEVANKVLSNCSKTGFGKFITVGKERGVQIFDTGATNGVYEDGVYFSNTLHRNLGQQNQMIRYCDGWSPD